MKKIGGGELVNENQFLSDLFSLPDDWNFRRSFYSELSENG
ncbi:hypothetical protein [Metabacillus idriensis]|nr:hypothetical protein [Metabacillus idriensis]